MDIPILAYMYRTCDYNSKTRSPLTHAIIREVKIFEVYHSVNHVTIGKVDYTLSEPYTWQSFLNDLKKAAAAGYDHTIIRTVTLLPYKSKYKKHAG